MFAKSYPKTPEEAVKEKTDYYYPDKICDRGHRSMRRACDGKCVRCARIEERESDCRD